MKQLLVICLLFVFAIGTTTIAQNSPKLDSIQKIIQITYQNKGASLRKTIVKESLFDTNQILVLQNRYNYTKIDTGLIVSTHYHFEYDPRYRQGFYYTERLAYNAKHKYSKHTTKFKSYDHKYKREWIKTYKKNSTSLLRHIKHQFDDNGYLVETVVVDYSHQPPSKTTEIVQRNKAGKMIKWESFDEDGDSKKIQARSFSATYKKDTLLLQSSGYLYFNWNQTINRYDNKNQLKKSIILVGNRSLKGKTKILDKTIHIYKNNLPFKTIEKRLNKKIKTIVYTYEDIQKIQTVTTPTKSYQDIKKYEYLADTLNLLSKYTETKEGKPYLEIYMEYDTLQQMTKHTEIEFRKNGKNWKTIKDYNSLGQLIQKTFYISDKVRRKEVYNYFYFPTANRKEVKD